MEMSVTDGAGGIVEVVLAGRLDTPGVAQLELRFTAALVPRAARAIVDLSKVEFIGSMGIRMFISVARARWPRQAEATARKERRIDANPTLLRFPGTLAGFQRGFVALRSALDGSGLRAEVRFRVELVFEEIVANIVRYAARPAGETHVEVLLETGPDVITLTFDDDGVAFDPCSRAAGSSADVPRPANLDEAPDGGFGLLMVHRTASKMSYRRTADARNHLTVELQAPTRSP